MAEGKIVRIEHPSRRQWTAREVERLGRDPDSRIASDLGIAPGTVARERRRRGIAPYRSPYEWTAESLALLGTESDSRVAAVLGVSVGVVTHMRYNLEIEAAFPRAANSRPTRNEFWTPERDALLGTASDAVVGRRLGIWGPVVRKRRSRLGIPPAHPKPRYDWSGVDPHLGEEVDSAIAKRFGINLETVRYRRIKLGIAPHQRERRTIRRDATLRRLIRRPTAEIEEVSSSQVVILRQELGVPTPPRRGPWTPEVLRRLGHEPDEMLAEQLGLSIHTVRMKRCELGRVKREFRRWSAADRDLLAEIADDEEAARRLGRTRKAVWHMRIRLEEEERE